MSFEEKIQLFFKAPNDFNPGETVYSTLFLLRRDIFTCFGINPNDQTKIGFEALFPGTMAIMAGIDLLAKFSYTDQEKKSNYSSDRFKKYTEKYISKEYKEELYQLRNALLHSFGLYSMDRTGKEFFFNLARGLEDLVLKISNENYLVDIEALRERFEASVLNYANELVDSEDLKKNFEAMFDKYGAIGIKKKTARL